MEGSLNPVAAGRQSWPLHKGTTHWKKTQTAWVGGGISMVGILGRGYHIFQCVFSVFWNYVIFEAQPSWRWMASHWRWSFVCLANSARLPPVRPSDFREKKTVVPRLPTNPRRLLPKMYWTGLPLWKCCGLSRWSTRVLLWRIGWDSLLSMPCRHGKPKSFSAVVCIKQHRMRFTDSGSYTRTVLFSGKIGKSEGGW